MPDFGFGTDEVVTIPWSLVDKFGAAVIPDAVAIVLASTSGDVAGTVFDAGDGTGTWTVDAPTLGIGLWRWHFLVTVGTDSRRPPGMSGILSIHQ